MRRMQAHHVQHGQLRIDRGKRRRNNGEIFRHVVGNTEGGQRTARH